jgi:hypothetical protein
MIGGWNWTWKPLSPKFDKLNPITGITRIFSKHQAVDALKASLLALILGTIGALYLNGHVDAFGGAMAMSLPSAMSSVGNTMVGGIVLLLIALALFAAVDAPWQMQQFAKRMRMSHHDIKQEHKESEGNGEINLIAALTRGPAHTSRIAASMLALPRTVSTGTGTLQDARGSASLTLDGITLAGERDIFGRSWNAGLMGSLTDGQATWNLTTGSFNGSAWIGSGFTADTATLAGRAWSGRTWAGRTWAGLTWSGQAWTGRTWAGQTWTGRTWASDSWD